MVGTTHIPLLQTQKLSPEATSNRPKGPLLDVAKPGQNLTSVDPTDSGDCSLQTLNTSHLYLHVTILWGRFPFYR